MTAKVVWIEGMDCTGKSTLSSALATQAVILGHYPKTCLDSSPSESRPIGFLIREKMRGRAPISSKAMLWLFLADMVDMEENLKPHIKEDDLVIVDRHTFVSSLVYQPEVHHQAVVEFANDSIPACLVHLPDLLVIVNAGYEQMLRRMDERHKEKEIYEKRDPIYWQRIAGRYDRIKELPIFRNKTLTLDAEMEIDKQVELIFNRLELTS